MSSNGGGCHVRAPSQSPQSAAGCGRRSRPARLWCRYFWTATACGCRAPAAMAAAARRRPGWRAARAPRRIAAHACLPC
eukprot:scaffold2010_cov301-Prasinococcus_capsulatus_cf.AAC.2